MAGRTGKKPHTVINRTAFLVGCRIIETPDTGKGYRPSAHGAGLERDIEIAIDKPVGLQCRRSGADSQQFGMGGGVGVLAHPVAAGSNNGSIPDDDRANRHFVPDGGFFCFRYCPCHVGIAGQACLASLSVL